MTMVIWISNFNVIIMVLDCFLNFRPCIRKLFSENVETLDFVKDPEASRAKINDFVNDVTRGNIKDLLVPGSISEQTKLVLANAAYFKGQWSSKFDAEDTKPRIFYDFGRIPVYVDMMKQRGYFNYGNYYRSPNIIWNDTQC